MQKILGTVTALALIGVSPESFGEQGNCESYHAAGYQALRSAQALAAPEIGLDSQVPRQTRELACILRRSDATELLISLSGEATKPGRLYALTGLYLVDRRAFAKLASILSNDTGTILFMDADIVTDRVVSEFVAEIGRGHFPKRFEAYIRE